MNQQKYVGSVRFFKNLILLVVILLILIPTGLAIGWRASLSSAHEELSALQRTAARTRELPVTAEKNVTAEKPAPVGEQSAWEILN